MSFRSAAVGAPRSARTFLGTRWFTRAPLGSCSAVTISATDPVTGAYDGPPLKQSDIEDRQKKIQEFVAKNNEDFAKKLKEEQDKAKAAN